MALEGWSQYLTRSVLGADPAHSRPSSHAPNGLLTIQGVVEL